MIDVSYMYSLLLLTMMMILMMSGVFYSLSDKTTIISYHVSFIITFVHGRYTAHAC